MIEENPNITLDSLEANAASHTEEIVEKAVKTDAKAGATLKSNKGIFSDMTRGLKRDFNIARNAVSKLEKTTTQEARAKTLREAGKTEEDIAKIMSKDMKVEQIGSKFLEEFGRGSKTAGAGKVAAYMVGGAMLVDMLNPFD